MATIETEQIAFPGSTNVYQLRDSRLDGLSGTLTDMNSKTPLSLNVGTTTSFGLASTASNVISNKYNWTLITTCDIYTASGNTQWTQKAQGSNTSKQTILYNRSVYSADGTTESAVFGDWKQIITPDDIPEGVVLDSTVSTTSTNGVQNGVITNYVDTAKTDAENLANATGTLSVANGGTGATSLDKVTVGNATNATYATTATNATNLGTADSGYTKSSLDTALSGKAAKADTIKSLSISGKTITYTKGDSSTGTLTTQDTTYSDATTSAHGLMTAAQVTKLAGIASGATANTGTVTSVTVKMNSAEKGTVTTSGTIDLGTVITAHQDITGKADKLTVTAGTAGTTSAQTPSYGSTFNIPYVTVNAQGLVSAYGTSTVKIPSTDNTNTTLSGIAYCSTAAATVAKTATMPNFALSSGQRILLQLVTTSSVASATLNVNGTGAKTVRISSAATTASNFTAGWYIANYDGTYWNVTKVYLTDTNTWRGIQNNLTSTSTTESLSAYQGKVLNEGKTGVKLNGATSVSTSASIYAPTDVGTSGQILKSSGSGAPSWATIDTALSTTSTNVLQNKVITSSLATYGTTGVVISGGTYANNGTITPTNLTGFTAVQGSCIRLATTAIVKGSADITRLYLTYGGAKGLLVTKKDGVLYTLQNIPDSNKTVFSAFTAMQLVYLTSQKVYGSDIDDYITANCWLIMDDPVIYETEGSQCCRLYASGYCEQWGYIDHGSHEFAWNSSVTLDVPYKDKTYATVVTLDQTDSSWVQRDVVIKEKTTTGFNIDTAGDYGSSYSGRYVSWITKGYVR